MQDAILDPGGGALTLSSVGLVFICVGRTGVFSNKKHYKMPSASGGILDSSWEEKETMELCLNASNYREKSWIVSGARGI